MKSASRPLWSIVLLSTLMARLSIRTGESFHRDWNEVQP